MGKIRYSTQTFNDYEILTRSFSGTITIPEVLDSFLIILNTYFTKNHNFIGLITDLTQANLNFKMLEFRSMTSFIKNNETLSAMPLGLIVNSPVNSLFPALASKVLGLQVKSFKTIEDAFVWCKKINELQVC